jgi:hypothetical protein
VIKIEVDGVVYEHDDAKIMLSEAQALQDLWNIDFEALNASLGAGTATLADLAATVWLVKVRALGVEQGIGFRKAAAQLPPEDFDFDLASMRMEGAPQAPNPTAAGTRTKGTRTTRATSAKPRTKRA